MPGRATSNGNVERLDILLVDDHKMVVDCLVPVLERAIPGARVVGTAEDGTAAVHEAQALDPDLVIMDIDLPGLGAFEAASRMMERSKGLRVLFLSAHRHDQYIQRALETGAHGYVVKMDGIDALVNAVKRIASGDLYYSPVVLARIRLEPDDPGSQETRLGALTPREREVLVMLAKGSSVRGVAAALNLSYKTVDKHKASMMKKLDIHDRVALCRYAVREHLIEA